MNKTTFFCGLLLLTMAATSCSERVTVADVQRSRILVDSRYDGRASAEVEEFLKPYTAVVDSIMRPVVGSIAVDAHAKRPEAPLSNLLADILVWAGSRHGERPVMGVYNMGGIRASLSRGTVTYGDVLEVAPFENKICFLTLTGDKLLELFRQIAKSGGQGMSRGVRLVISADGDLLSATLHGSPINPTASYRIATIDYLAAGNDGMTAFADKINYHAPQIGTDCRDVITAYFRAMDKAGREIKPTIEGRITISE